MATSEGAATGLYAHTRPDASRATTLRGQQLLLARTRCLHRRLLPLDIRMRGHHVDVRRNALGFTQLGTRQGGGRSRQALVVEVVEVGEVRFPP